MGFAGTFLKKFPAHSKIFLRPHIPCASGNRLMQCLRQQIQDLRFKINAKDILFDKVLENQNLNNIAYNFVPKNAMSLRFDKSFTRFFSKNRGVLGQRPKVFQSDKFIFNHKKPLK